MDSGCQAFLKQMCWGACSANGLGFAKKFELGFMSGCLEGNSSVPTCGFEEGTIWGYRGTGVHGVGMQENGSGLRIAWIWREGS